MSWKNQLIKAPFGPFKRKKPEPEPAETPEEARKREENNLIIQAVDIVNQAANNDKSSYGVEHDMRLIQEFNDKVDKYYSNNFTYMGSGGIEGLKSFIRYLGRSSNSYAAMQASEKAISFVESKEGELQ